MTQTKKQRQKQEEQAAVRSAEEIAKEIITKSGNGFHTKVATFFRERDWTVRLGQYYVDAATDKAREIDLIIERVFEYGKPYKNAIHVRARLIVECKYVAHDTVFWIDAMDRDGAVGLITRKTPLSTKSTHINDHHYLQQRPVVAKLFATEAKENNQESDPIFRALNQCLNGFVNARNEQLIASRTSAKAECTLVYPVIIFHNFDRFHQTSMAGPTEVKPLRQNFLFEAHYAYKTRKDDARTEYILVDMVPYDQLDKFIASLVKEVEAVREVAQPDEDDEWDEIRA